MENSDFTFRPSEDETKSAQPLLGQEIGPGLALGFNTLYNRSLGVTTAQFIGFGRDNLVGILYIRENEPLPTYTK
ncbi:MAG: hypothetical protein AAB587_02130 [Patescibacteria group bacterium]